MNEIDDYGFALIHYFSYLNYHEAIKLLADIGVDLNIKTQNSLSNNLNNSLLIATA
jgi:hypothetical protein